jgi:uncharacterized peroxidase-related enzyme
MYNTSGKGCNRGGSKMAWIKVINESEAAGALSQSYNTIRSATGRVANILKVHSLHREALDAHLTLYRELMFRRSELSRDERELIAVAVSAVNDCHY